MPMVERGKGHNVLRDESDDSDHLDADGGAPPGTHQLPVGHLGGVFWLDRLYDRPNSAPKVLRCLDVRVASFRQTDLRVA